MMKELSLFALLLCNFFLQAQQVFFSKPDGVTLATVGENVTFPWKFTFEAGKPLVMIRMEYSKTKQFEGSEKQIAYRTPSKMFITGTYKLRFELTGALTLYNVSVEQQGFYKCAVLVEGQNKWLSSKAQLLVGTPPVIFSSPPSEMTLLEGDSVNLTCKTRGIPSPDVSWYKQMQYGWKDLRRGTVRLTDVTTSSSGHYRCSASNFMGLDEKTVKIVVYERPKVTSFFHSAALDDTIYECEEVTITCEAHGNIPPVKSVNIYHEGRPLQRSIDRASDGSARLLAGGSRDGRLRIARVRKEHEGRYSCRAENEHGYGESRTMNLTVFAAPSNCERKTTAPTTRITKLQNTTVSSTGRSSPTTGEVNVQGKHSGSQTPGPSLLLFVVWTWLLLLRWFS